MWGISIVLGVIGIGLTLWEIASRPSVAPAPVPPGRVAPASALALQRAQQCGLLGGDVRDAQRWVLLHLGPTIELLPGLELMKGTIPYANWPMSAKRVLCVYSNGPVPPPSVGKQIEDAVFPRYGGA